MEVEGNIFPSISEDLIISFKYIFFFFGKEPASKQRFMAT